MGGRGMVRACGLAVFALLARTGVAGAQTVQGVSALQQDGFTTLPARQPLPMARPGTHGDDGAAVLGPGVRDDAAAVGHRAGRLAAHAVRDGQ